MTEVTEAEIFRQHLAAAAGQRQAIEVEEPAPIVVLQQLLLEDEKIYSLILGDLKKEKELLHQLIYIGVNRKTIDIELAEEILETLRRIERILLRYKRYRPYLFILNQLTRTTYFTEKEADLLKKEIAVCISRDLMDMDEDELELTDVNFLTLLEKACQIAVQDAVRGWKARVVTEQRRRVVFEGAAESERKKPWWKFWGK